MIKRGFLSLLVAITVLLSAFALPISADTVINPNNASQNGFSLSTTSCDGLAQFVNGPSTPPLGTGSVQLFTGTNGTGTSEIANSGYTDTRLDDILNLSYSTYVTSWDGTRFPFLVIEVFNGQASDTLLWFPEENGSRPGVPTPTLNTWQNWQVTGNLFLSTGTTLGFVTLEDYLAFFPNAQVSGNIELQYGFGAQQSDVFNGYVDNLAISAGGSDQIYNFEYAPTNGVFTRTIFKNNNFTNPANTTLDSNQNFISADWGNGNPAPCVQVDNFSARWEGSFTFESGYYRFSSKSDNITNIYLDGNLVSSEVASDAFNSGYANVTAGVHTVRVDYVHATGNSSVAANFWKYNKCYDLDASNKADAVDIGIVRGHFNQSANPFATWDLNLSGKTDAVDIALVRSKFNVACPY